MNVTTEKSERHQGPRMRRQLEVALDHAKAAGIAAAERSSLLTTDAAAPGFKDTFVGVRYPTYEFREVLKSVCSFTIQVDESWMVLDFRKIGAHAQEACRAACTVLRHYYPDEDFIVAQCSSASALDTAQL